MRVRLLVSVLIICGCHAESPPSDVGMVAKSGAASPAADVEGGQPSESELPQLASPQPATGIRLSPLSPGVFPEVICENGEDHHYLTLLEVLGGGVAATDVDRDGLEDALVAGGGDFDGRTAIGKPIWFLRNGFRQFQNQTDPAALASTGLYHHGLAVADADQDGFDDVLVTGFGGLLFFRNQGDGTFAEDSRSAGLISGDWHASAAWGDFNRDGALDIYVTAYVNWSFSNDPPCFAADGKTRDNCTPKLFDPLPDRLFLNRGDGTFADATSDFHVRPDGKGLGVVAADLDADGFTDVYVGNDVMLNFLYHNQAGKSFEDVSVTSGAGVSSRGAPDASMGVDAADYNRDGRFDLWAANFEMESFAVYQNQGQMMFRHMSDETGVAAIGDQFVGWGSVFVDLDRDGDEDLCTCNGHVVRYPAHAPVLQRLLILENESGDWFEDVTTIAGDELNVPKNGRGLAVTDWNRDGRPDLLFSAIQSPAVLFENTCSDATAFLQISLAGTVSPRLPIGTVVEAQTSDGIQVRQLKGGGSYASTSSSVLHFAVRPGTRIERLKIRWTSGVIQQLPCPEMNAHWLVIEPSAGVLVPSPGDHQFASPDSSDRRMVRLPQ